MANLQSVLFFDGQNDQIIYANPIDKFKEAISIEFWANATSNFTGNTSVVGGSDGNNGNFINIHLPWSDSIIYWDAGTPFNRINKKTETREYQGSWNHWAFIKDSTKGEMVIYRNGELWHSGQGQNSPLGKMIYLCVGSLNKSSYFWGGHLAELRFWNIALTQSQIKKNINKRLTGKELGLELYWPLNEGEGTIIKDLSGNGYDGQINGAIWQEMEIPLEIQEKELIAKKVKAQTSLATGLEDYGYWYKWQKNLPEPTEKKPFRRGRIWA